MSAPPDKMSYPPDKMSYPPDKICPHSPRPPLQNICFHLLPKVSPCVKKSPPPSGGGLLAPVPAPEGRGQEDPARHHERRIPSGAVAACWILAAATSGSACSPLSVLIPRATQARASRARAEGAERALQSSQSGAQRSQEGRGRPPERQASELGHAAAPTTRRELRKMSLLRKWGRGPNCAKVPRFAQIAASGTASVAGRAIGSAVHPERRAPCTKIRAGAQARAVARAPTKEATKRRARAAPPAHTGFVGGAARPAPRPSPRRGGDAVGAPLAMVRAAAGDRGRHFACRQA